MLNDITHDTQGAFGGDSKTMFLKGSRVHEFRWEHGRGGERTWVVIEREGSRGLETNFRRKKTAGRGVEEANSTTTETTTHCVYSRVE